MAAETVKEITFQGLLGTFSNATLRIQLRRNGAKWWARALWDDGNAGAGRTKIGTLKLRVSDSAHETFYTKKTKVLYSDDTTIWTDETYDPPNGRKILARFVANWAVSTYYPKGQSTPRATT